jgi:predicted MFS family arabinose efflux permease
VLRNPRLVLALSITVTYAASVFTIFSYIGAFLRGYADLSPAQVSATLTGFGVAALAGTFLGGWGTDRLGATRMLYAVCVAFAAIFGAIWALPGASGPLVAITLFWGTVGFAFMPAQTTRLVAMSPQDAPALMSLSSATISGGTALGAAIGGAVIAVWGYRGLPVACAALVAAVALLVRATEPTPVAAQLRPQHR